MRTFRHLAELAALRGEEIGASDWVPVDQARIDRFAQATGDAQWIHVDPVRAAAGPYGTTVVHGFLTLALLPELFASALAIEDVRMAVNYGLNRVRFPAPLPVASRVRAGCRLLSFEAIDGGAQLITAMTIERAGAPKPVCVAEWITRHFT